MYKTFKKIYTMWRGILDTPNLEEHSCGEYMTTKVICISIMCSFREQVVMSLIKEIEESFAIGQFMKVTSSNWRALCTLASPWPFITVFCLRGSQGWDQHNCTWSPGQSFNLHCYNRTHTSYISDSTDTRSIGPSRVQAGCLVSLHIVTTHNSRVRNTQRANSDNLTFEASTPHVWILSE